jgi:2-iminobutanoate/2-iminopropanoate deaminase
MPKQCFGTAAVPLSPAVRAGDFVFVSGQVPVGADGKVVAGGIGRRRGPCSRTCARRWRWRGADSRTW